MLKLVNNVLHFFVFFLFWPAGASMSQGGTWGICLVGVGTPLMTAGGVTPIGRRTGRAWLIVQLGLGRMP